MPESFTPEQLLQSADEYERFLNENTDGPDDGCECEDCAANRKERQRVAMLRAGAQAMKPKTCETCANHLPPKPGQVVRPFPKVVADDDFDRVVSRHDGAQRCFWLIRVPQTVDGKPFGCSLYEARKDGQ